MFSNFSRGIPRLNRLNFLGMLFVLSVCSLNISARAEAQANEPSKETEKPFLNVNHMVGIQYGPLGLFYEIDPYFRWDLFPGTENILLKDAHIAAGLTGFLTPSVAYYGPSLTVAPLTILHVNVQFTHTISGVMGKQLGLLNYDSNEDPDLDADLGQFGDYSYAFRADHGEELGRVTAKIWTLFIRPSVFLQFGPVVFVYLGTYMYFHPTEYTGLYYNDIADMVLSPKSWCLINDGLLLYEIANLKNDGWGLLLGVSNHMTFTIDDGDLTELESTYRWKVGPSAMWTIADEWFDRTIEQPTLMFQAHAYIKDPIAEEARRYVGAMLIFMISTNWYR